MSFIELGGTVKSGGPFSTVDGNSQTAPNFADPVNPQDLATKNYVDMTTSSGTALLAGRVGGQVLHGGTSAGEDLTLVANPIDVNPVTLVLQSTTSGGAALFNSDISWVYKGGGGGRFYGPYVPTGPNLPGDSLNFFGGPATGTAPGGDLGVFGGDGDQSGGTGDGGNVAIQGGAHALSGGTDGKVTIKGSSVIVLPWADGSDTFQIRNASGGTVLFYTNTDIDGNPQSVHINGANTKFEAQGDIQFDGPNLSVNGVPYVFPALQGGASTVLTNDGAGNLTWLAAGGGGTADGVILPTSFTCPTGVSVRDAVYITGDDAVDKADASNPAERPARGFVASKPTAVTCKMQTSGEMTGFSGLVAGDAYVLDVTSGNIVDVSATSGFATGSIIQHIGWARNTTTLVIELDDEFTVL